MPDKEKGTGGIGAFLVYTACRQESGVELFFTNRVI